MTPLNRTLVIMAKAPRVGAVKTRLAKSLPPQSVNELYRCFLEDTIVLARSLDGVEVAIMCPDCDVEDLRRETRGAVRIVPQIGKGLAAGLTSVFEHFAGGQKQAVAFNCDSPHLPAAVLQNAFHSLATSDVVIGPTYDGGYYLVGAGAAHPDLFTGDGMGTTNAFEALVARARNLQLSVHLTDSFYDIDEVAELERLAAELQRTPEKAPKTAAWLSAWRSAAAQSANNGRNE
jgi:rSAM/selenodomain-associated transferase 1